MRATNLLLGALLIPCIACSDKAGDSCSSLCQHMGQVCDDYLDSDRCTSECEKASPDQRTCLETAQKCGAIAACLSDCVALCQHMGQVCDDYLDAPECVSECGLATSAQRACVQKAQSCGQIKSCIGA